MKAWLAAVAIVAIPGMASAEAFDLLCKGAGTWQEKRRTSGFVGTNDGGFASGGLSTFGRGSGPQQLRVRIEDGGVGRIKMPPAMVPGLNGGGKDGWWTFSELQVGDDQITAKFSFNVVNKPKVVIDRRTGDIDLKGYEVTFSGVCERSEDTPETRKF